jgi:lipopolysaccharide transport system ATP-binding protein
VVGLIGRNGSGKSTLLKLLGRITEPTEGEATIRGRVGTLLEVGTGFHPELSARDNIYLSGAILGMKRGEVRRKFDEIVSFAEVEKFVDTPVKRFSSGMYTRLGFSVAAHLETEILLLDEVLAVGDAAFQRKCLGRMRDVASEGRTVIFVSHNLAVLQALCSHGLTLKAGSVVTQGPIEACIAAYLSDLTTVEATQADLRHHRRPPYVDDTLRIESAELLTRRNRPLIAEDDPLEVRLLFRLLRPVEDLVLIVVLTSAENVRVMECRSNHTGQDTGVVKAASYSTVCRIVSHNLGPGHYFIGVGARCSTKHLDWIPEVLRFQVFVSERASRIWLDDAQGLLRVQSEWSPLEPERASCHSESTPEHDA